MQKDIRQIIENEIDFNENFVWVLQDLADFQYSDGAASENYLKRVFLSANDLSSNSHELEKWIKDWPSAYHLSRKRAQLLRGFDFDAQKKVLEVGCGCGAITRFLGETFNDVLAIEGSIRRAELARLRTKGMDNVAILCAPFQKIKFKRRFDIIFCIGVFEYASVFIDAPDPYDYILQYFSNILTPDGVVVIAIENQFGLKYFSSSKEDHTGIMFDGLEGYARYGARKARTFGYGVLKKLLSQHFQGIDFYFPYPDYKTPSCILSESFFCKAKAGELVGRYQASPYLANVKSLYDEKLVLLEIDKNNMLPFFSNSFLIVAGKQDILSINSKYLGLIFSNHRVERFETLTSFSEQDDGGLLVEKKPLNGQAEVETSFINLRKCESRWIDGLSLHTQVMKRAKEKDLTLEELFAPCKVWLAHMMSLSSKSDNKLLLDGKYIDCIWCNTFIVNGECKFIDYEWVWHEKIDIKILLIRCLHVFFNDVSNMKNLNNALLLNSIKSMIINISKSLGVEIQRSDLKEYYIFASRIDYVVRGKNFIRSWMHVKLFFWNKSIIYLLSFGRKFIINLSRKFDLLVNLLNTY